MSKDLLFDVPPDRAKALLKSAKEGSKYKIVDGVVKGRSPGMWFASIDHDKTRTKLDLASRYSPENHPSHDDHDAMGVPISFLDQHNPDQFEIISANDIRRHGQVPIRPHGLIKDKDGTIDGEPEYARIVIRNRNPAISSSGHPAAQQSGRDRDRLDKEGLERTVTLTQPERSPKNRMKAIRRHGVRCFGCELKMAEMYGVIAEGFIHIHHVKPLGKGRDQSPRIDDLIPPCPNCHAVVHLEDPPVTLERLREIVANNNLKGDVS